MSNGTNNGSAAATFDLGSQTALLRTAFGVTSHLGALVGGANTSLRGATNTADQVTYQIGEKNLSTTFAGTIADGSFSTPGKTAIIKDGTGSLTLSNSNSSYTGSTTLQKGELRIANIANGGINSAIGASDNSASNLVFNGGTLKYTGAAVQSNRNFTITAAGGTIDASGTGTLEFRNNGGSIAMSGTGARTLTLTGSNTGWNSLDLALGDGADGATSLIKEGTGTWRILSHLNSYTGDTIVRAGTLIAWYADSMPNGNLTIDAGAIYDTNGNSRSIGGLNGSGTFYDAANTIRTLTVGIGNASGNFSGTLAEGSASQTINLVKTGSGVQILSGNNFYKGTTDVQGGSLIVNGHSGTGQLTVRSGALLGGSGTVGGNLLAQGQVSPGNSPGTLTVDGNATFADGSLLTIELASATSYDRLLVTGNLNLQSNSSLQILLSGLVPANGMTFDILDWGSLTGSFSTIILPNLGNGYSFDTADLYTSGTLALHLSAVPEPSSAVLLLAVGLFACRARGRRC